MAIKIPVLRAPVAINLGTMSLTVMSNVMPNVGSQPEMPRDHMQSRR